MVGDELNNMCPRIAQACTLRKVHNKPLKHQTTTSGVRFEKAYQNHDYEILRTRKFYMDSCTQLLVQVNKDLYQILFGNTCV